ncbi:MAG TPA: malectin domain-containing carbohydrate-binding protein [Terriglobales bacterium]|jgi:hypothetical protein|nr:malectin domain-containing carbohydrate-binding protein [Terriglobales bacterium]
MLISLESCLGMEKLANNQSTDAAQESGNAGQNSKKAGSSAERAALHEPDHQSMGTSAKVTANVVDSFTPDVKASVQLTNEQERAELARVLGSEMFKRSPKLSRLLSYLCDKYFNGEGNELKEYSIAVDVLGRDTEFDPQLNAVVRVDTHHLRKRLKQYYAAEGSSHQIEIVVPTGQYTPKFVPIPESIQRPAEPQEAELTDEASLPAVEEIEKRPAEAERAEEKLRASSRKWLWFAIGLAVAAVAGPLLWTTFSRPRLAEKEGATQSGATAATVPHGEDATQSKTAPAGALPGETEAIRILAGDHNGNYVDKAGHLWLSDRYFKGGETFRRDSREIARTQDPEIFLSGREGQFVYEIPLSPGTYELHLYFAETSFESEALRSVSLAINGLPVSTLDVASDAEGVNTATMKIFKDISPAKDGILHLTFQGTGPSFVNALEILPGTPGKMLPVRIAARDTTYRDQRGHVWVPDQYFLGGRRSSRKTAIEGTADPELYIAQRFGHFTYSIPVAEGGHYAITLYFAETYFATPESAGGIGSRVFDVYCNGTTLLKDFDILKESGGVGNRAVVKVFHKMPASPQGKINLTFVPINNYALVTAIEVAEE